MLTATMYDIRWMIRRDMPHVLAVEEASFDAPWSEDDFTGCLRQRNCIGLVAEAGMTIPGFMIYFMERRHWHIANLAVSSGWRRHGVATALVARLIKKLDARRPVIRTEVRETNRAAQEFFKACGFRAVGVLREHYLDTDEDAYLFRYEA